MKKSFIVFGLLLVMIFSSTSILAVKDEIKRHSEVKKIVTVGYYREDKKEIFGDLSDEEIRKILHDKIQDLMKSETLELQNIENNYLKNLDSKLIISISDKENDFEYNNSDKFNNIDEIVLLGIDEEYVSGYVDYSVGFELPGLGVAYGDYVSVVEGIVSFNQYAVIEKLTTINIGGARFPVKDYVYGTAEAHNIFYSIDAENIRFGRGDFAINRQGTIMFYGVR